MRYPSIPVEEEKTEPSASESRRIKAVLVAELRVLGYEIVDLVRMNSPQLTGHGTLFKELFDV
jgi:hypothetical protein